MLRDFYADVNVAVRFANDNFIAHWNNTKRCKSNMYLGLYYRDDDYLTFQLTDHDYYEEPSLNLIFELEISKYDVDVDLYKEFTNKMKELPHNIKDNPISWEEYQQVFKLKWDDIMSKYLDSFPKAVDKQRICQYVLTKLLIYSTELDKQYLFTLYTWIGCSNKSLEDYPKEVINFLGDCIKKHYLTGEFDYNFIKDYKETLEFFMNLN